MAVAQHEGYLSTASPRKHFIRRLEIRWGLFFLSPWIIGFLLFSAFPMAASFILSMTDFKTGENKEVHFVGLENYLNLLSIEFKQLETPTQKAIDVLSPGYHYLGIYGSTVIGVKDTAFWQSLKVTLLFALMSLPTGLLVALSLALLTNLKMRGIGIYRTVFFLPYVIPAISMVTCFRLLFTGETGWINVVLRGLGFSELDWLYHDRYILPALVLISLWTVGNAMMIYLSGLQNVPTELYEAAKVDGANGVTAFLNITLPLISPVILYNLVIGLISSFQYFTIPFALISQANNSFGTAAENFNFYNYNLYTTAFRYLQMGYASAMAWILFVIVVAITVTVFATSNQWVFYAGVNERK
jgi:multiple sugar transport system permease protein